MAKSAEVGSPAFWEYIQKNSQDEFRGVKLLAAHLHDGSLFHFATKRVQSVDEMKGLKVRGPTRIGTRFLTALGVTPVQMPLPQGPEAIAKGVIDGAMVPWEGTPPIKLHEIARYALDNAPGQPKMSNSIFVIAMNQAKYDSLPADLRKVIDANSGLAWSAQIGKVFDGTTEPAKKLAVAAQNVFDTLSPAEYTKMQAAAEVVTREWIGDVGAKGANGQQLLDDAKALIRKHGT
jgi:TRAP-type C4-dicarboxylate transport system substrate-binding protein